jgi:glycosyltransferase involved in cell wall biosynthesis
MRVLLVHNYYQQPGGEDQSFAAEGVLLEARGHEVIRHTVHNDRVGEYGRVRLAARTVWSAESYGEIRALIARERPDVIHCQNTFPLISPSAYYAAAAEGVPVVQTLHNYRLVCPAAVLFRRGKVCEACVGKALPWPGVLHGCYRSNRLASAAVAAMLTAHRAAGTWRRTVTTYIALTEFARAKLAEGGLPADRIWVKPNFVDPDPGPGPGGGGYALFVGRLSPEKGIDTLLEAWRGVGGVPPLRIVGDGPMAARVHEAVRTIPGVEWLGRRTRPEILRLMGEAAFLVFPSTWYEGLPLTIVEAFSRGLPVIASALGSMAEIVEDGRTGLHARPGDAGDLRARVQWAADRLEVLARMRRAARAEYEAKYTAARNYDLLRAIYADAVGQAGRRPDQRVAR